MKQLYRVVSAFVAAVTSTLAMATPPNTTASASVPYEVGQGWVTHFFDETTQTRWFRFAEMGGHSYCVEAVQGSVSPIQLDPNVTVYTSTSGTTTLVVSSVNQANDDGAGSPYFIKGARTCYISPLSWGQVVQRAVKLNVPIVASSGDNGNIRLRLVETTLYGDVGSEAAGGCVVAVTNLSSSYVAFGIYGLAATQSTTVSCPGGATLMFPHSGPPGAVRAAATIYSGGLPFAVIPLRTR